MKCKIVNKSNLDFGQFKPLLSSFMNFAVKRMGFQKPPTLFFSSDAENAEMPLGKTAHYNPASLGVTIYTDKRHPKDILRSLSHELVHHKQNCDGQFDKMGEMGEGYAQNDSHLRSMEEEAYLVGNMCFRDWEDTHKKQLQESNYYFRGDKKMKLYEWKNAELATLIKEKFNIPEGDYKRDTEEEDLEEGGLANRKGDPRQRRPEASPIREEEEEPEEELEEGWEDEKASQEEDELIKFQTQGAAPATFSSKGDRSKDTFASRAKARQKSRPRSSMGIRGVTAEDKALDEVKVRKAVREALKKYMAK